MDLTKEEFKIMHEILRNYKKILADLNYISSLNESTQILSKLSVIEAKLIEAIEK